MREALLNCLRGLWNVLTWTLRAAGSVVRALMPGGGGGGQAQEDAQSVAATAEQQQAAAETAAEDARKLLQLISKILGMRAVGLVPEPRLYDDLPKETGAYLSGLTDAECAVIRSRGKSIAGLIMHGRAIEGVRSPGQVAAANENVVPFQRRPAPKSGDRIGDEEDFENVISRARASM